MLLFPEIPTSIPKHSNMAIDCAPFRPQDIYTILLKPALFSLILVQLRGAPENYMCSTDLAAHTSSGMGGLGD